MFWARFRSPFSIRAIILASKSDREGRGGEKTVQHHPAVRASPGAFFLAYARLRLHKEKRAIRNIANEPLVFPLKTPLFVFTSLNKPLSFWSSARMISYDLSAIAVRCDAGTPRSKGRMWRSASCSWLIKNGVLQEEVLKRGLWRSAETVTDHYFKFSDQNEQQLSMLFGRRPS